MDNSRRRANGSPTCSSAPKPIGPGRRLPGRALTSPRLVAGATPTTRTPCEGQPLHEHALPAPRTPALHFGAHGGRGRVRHTLGKSEATAPDDERRGVMNPYPIPVRVLPFPGNLRGPGRVHDDELDTAPSALSFNCTQDLPGAKQRKDLREASSVLLEPCLFLAEVEVLGNDRDAPRGSDHTQQPRSVVDVVVALVQLPPPRVEQPSVARDERRRDVVRVEVKRKRAVGCIGANGRLRLLVRDAKFDLAPGQQLHPPRDWGPRLDARPEVFLDLCRKRHVIQRDGTKPTWELQLEAMSLRVPACDFVPVRLAGLAGKEGVASATPTPLAELPLPEELSAPRSSAEADRGTRLRHGSGASRPCAWRRHSFAFSQESCSRSPGGPRAGPDASKDGHVAP